MKRQTHINFRIIPTVFVIGLPIILSHPVFASDGNVMQVENFIKSIIQVLAGLAGLVATGFFVAGGFGYITSSGNPEHLEKAKHTLLYSGIGLAIVIAAFVISNIITDLATSAFGK
ncbi:MAG TPA: pilin [Candidatus Saccharimonadia bacterium]|nr:pilin [Candidatus Saccharimonadia bacterium]